MQCHWCDWRGERWTKMNFLKFSQNLCITYQFLRSNVNMTCCQGNGKRLWNIESLPKPFVLCWSLSLLERSISWASGDSTLSHPLRSKLYHLVGCVLCACCLWPSKCRPQRDDSKNGSTIGINLSSNIHFAFSTHISSSTCSSSTES